ncbi:MAG: response regulator [Gammaproteobacteria bacterium]|nr:response regulator [Gammaproteobacteria bacterium]
MPRPRVLIVEDTLLVARFLEEVCEALALQVVGPAGTVQGGLALAREAAIDLAILDINLHDELVFPVADALVARGIPFFFSSGYTAKAMIPERFVDQELLSKPYEVDALMVMVKRTLARISPVQAASSGES